MTIREIQNTFGVTWTDRTEDVDIIIREYWKGFKKLFPNCELYDFEKWISENNLNGWEDTLDFIDQMDCIVSSCTSLVHAAGAMGKTTFVIVPIAEYYIWTSSSKTTKSPWYGDNVTLLRQEKPRCWKAPLDKLRKILFEKGLLK
jgi:hypothetical protein